MSGGGRAALGAADALINSGQYYEACSAFDALLLTIDNTIHPARAADVRLRRAAALYGCLLTQRRAELFDLAIDAANSADEPLVACVARGEAADKVALLRVRATRIFAAVAMARAMQWALPPAPERSVASICTGLIQHDVTRALARQAAAEDALVNIAPPSKSGKDAASGRTGTSRSGDDARLQCVIVSAARVAAAACASSADVCDVAGGVARDVAESALVDAVAGFLNVYAASCDGTETVRAALVGACVASRALRGPVSAAMGADAVDDVVHRAGPRRDAIAGVALPSGDDEAARLGPAYAARNTLMPMIVVPSSANSVAAHAACIAALEAGLAWAWRSLTSDAAIAWTAALLELSPMSTVARTCRGLLLSITLTSPHTSAPPPAAAATAAARHAVLLKLIEDIEAGANAAVDVRASPFCAAGLAALKLSACCVAPDRATRVGYAAAAARVLQSALMEATSPPMPSASIDSKSTGHAYLTAEQSIATLRGAFETVARWTPVSVACCINPLSSESAPVAAPDAAASPLVLVAASDSTVVVALQLMLARADLARGGATDASVLKRSVSSRDADVLSAYRGSIVASALAAVVAAEAATELAAVPPILMRGAVVPMSGGFVPDVDGSGLASVALVARTWAPLPSVIVTVALGDSRALRAAADAICIAREAVDRLAEYFHAGAANRSDWTHWQSLVCGLDATLDRCVALVALTTGDDACSRHFSHRSIETCCAARTAASGIVGPAPPSMLVLLHHSLALTGSVDVHSNSVIAPWSISSLAHFVLDDAALAENYAVAALVDWATGRGDDPTVMDGADTVALHPCQLDRVTRPSLHVARLLLGGSPSNSAVPTPSSLALQAAARDPAGAGVGAFALLACIYAASARGNIGSGHAQRIWLRAPAQTDACIDVVGVPSAGAGTLAPGVAERATERARACAARAFSLARGSAAACSVLCDTLLAHEHGARERAAGGTNAADAAAVDRARAIATLEAVVQDEPRAGWAWLRLGALALQNGAAALRVAAEHRAPSPDKPTAAGASTGEAQRHGHPPHIAARLHIEAAHRDLDAACNAFQHATSLLPSPANESNITTLRAQLTIRAWYGLARTYRLQGKAAAAVSAATSAVVAAGINMEDLAQLTRALTSCTRATAPLLALLGECAAAAGDAELALRALTAADAASRQRTNATSGDSSQLGDIAILAALATVTRTLTRSCIGDGNIRAGVTHAFSGVGIVQRALDVLAAAAPTTVAAAPEFRGSAAYPLHKLMGDLLSTTYDAAPAIYGPVAYAASRVMSAKAEDASGVHAVLRQAVEDLVAIDKEGGLDRVPDSHSALEWLLRDVLPPMGAAVVAAANRASAKPNAPSSSAAQLVDHTRVPHLRGRAATLRPEDVLRVRDAGIDAAVAYARAVDCAREHGALPSDAVSASWSDLGRSLFLLALAVVTACAGGALPLVCVGSSAPAHSVLSYCLASADRARRAAAACFRAAAGISPESSRAWNGLGVTCLDGFGRDESVDDNARESVHALIRSIELRGGGIPLVNLAAVATAAGRFPVAAQLLLEAQTSDPNNEAMWSLHAAIHAAYMRPGATRLPPLLTASGERYGASAAVTASSYSLASDLGLHPSALLPAAIYTMLSVRERSAAWVLSRGTSITEIADRRRKAESATALWASLDEANVLALLAYDREAALPQTPLIVTDTLLVMADTLTSVVASAAFTVGRDTTEVIVSAAAPCEAPCAMPASCAAPSTPAPFCVPIVALAVLREQTAVWTAAPRAFSCACAAAIRLWTAAVDAAEEATRRLDMLATLAGYSINASGSSTAASSDAVACPLAWRGMKWRALYAAATGRLAILVLRDAADRGTRACGPATSAPAPLTTANSDLRQSALDATSRLVGLHPSGSVNAALLLREATANIARSAGAVEQGSELSSLAVPAPSPGDAVLTALHCLFFIQTFYGAAQYADSASDGVVESVDRLREAVRVQLATLRPADETQATAVDAARNVDDRSRSMDMAFLAVASVAGACVGLGGADVGSLISVAGPVTTALCTVLVALHAWRRAIADATPQLLAATSQMRTAMAACERDGVADSDAAAMCNAACRSFVEQVLAEAESCLSDNTWPTRRALLLP